MRTAASAGPRPSCRSRRTRRRSASLAVTSAWRERCASSPAETAWTTAATGRARSLSTAASAARIRWPARRDRQRADLPASEEQRHAERGRRCGSETGEHAPPRRLDGHMVEPQRLGHRVHHLVEDVVDRRRVIETLTEARQRSVRIPTIAVDHPVDHPLHPVTGHREDRHRHPRRHHRPPHVDLSADHPVGRRHQAQVRRGDQDRETAVDERPAHDQMEVPEPVAEHRHPDAGHEQRHRQRSGDGEDARVFRPRHQLGQHLDREDGPTGPHPSELLLELGLPRRFRTNSDATATNRQTMKPT